MSKNLLGWDVAELISGLATDIGCEVADLSDQCMESEIMQSWEEFLERLGEILEEYSPDDRWHVDVEGFGWRNLDGEANINVENAEDFLRKVLPDCECTFYVYDDSDAERNLKGLKINNYHHDSPTGEWYYCSPLTEEEYANN